MKNIERKIKQARLKMFRKDIGLMLFGASAYKFNWVVAKLSKQAEGGILFDLNSNKVEDGNIYINQDFISQEDYTYDNLVALITHEIIHILQKHGHRRGNRNPKLWNFACDHVTDRDLKEFGLRPYKDHFNIIEELHNRHPKCTAEEAYTWINDQTPRFDVGDIKMGDKNENDQNENVQSFTVTDGKTGEKFEVTNTPDENSQISQEDKEKLKQKVDQFVSEARAQN